MDILATLFLLIVLYEVKHFVADYLLQTAWIYKGKTRPGWSYVIPLGVHAGLHALGSLVILLYFAPHLWMWAFFDFGTHFAMDRIKSSPRLLGRYSNTSKRAFWICVGIDQTVHHLVHYYIVYKILVA
jgi:hypothetical protein